MDIFNPIFTEYFQYSSQDTNLKLDEQLIIDLGLYDLENGLLKSLDSNFTVFGTLFLLYTLKHPNTQTDIYQDKYKYLDTLSKPQHQNIKHLFQEIKKIELDLQWFWKPRTRVEKELIESVSFKTVLGINLNQSKVCLMTQYIMKQYIQPIYSLITPTLSFILPYFVIRYQLKFQLSFHNYLKLLKIFVIPNNSYLNLKSFNLFSFLNILTILYGILYIYSIYSNIKDILKVYRIHTLLYQKLNDIKQFLHTTKKLSVLHEIVILEHLFLRPVKTWIL